MSETLSDPVDIMARTLWGEARGRAYLALPLWLA